MDNVFSVIKGDSQVDFYTTKQINNLHLAYVHVEDGTC